MSQEYELIYWPIRGLGAMCRVALVYSGIPFKDSRTATWYAEEGSERPALTEANALMNLPCLKLPSGESIAQTQAILRYIARNGSLKPQTETDNIRVDQVMETLVDMNAEWLKMVYGENAKENTAGFFAETVPYYYGALEQFAVKNNTSFLASNYPTIADLWHAEKMAGLEKLKGGLEWAAAFPQLVAIYKKIMALPQLQAYFEAERAVPFNSPDYAAWA